MYTDGQWVASLAVRAGTVVDATGDVTAIVDTACAEHVSRCMMWRPTVSGDAVSTRLELPMVSDEQVRVHCRSLRYSPPTISSSAIGLEAIALRCGLLGM